MSLSRRPSSASASLWRCRGRRLSLVALLFGSLGPAVQAESAAPANSPLPVSSQAPAYAVRLWDRDSGLPQQHLTAVIQTNDGYLWCGTYNGLVRFDGARFVVFDPTNTPGLRDGRIVALCQARDGSLWIGHENGNLAHFRDGRVDEVKVSSDPSLPAALALAEDGNGRIWAAKTIQVVKDTQGVLWVCRHGELARIGPEGEVPVPVKRTLEGESVAAIGAARQGGLWMVQEGSFRRWQDGRWLEDWGPPPWGRDLGSSRILLELTDGTIAGGSADSGLFLWRRGQRPQIFDVAGGLPHPRVRGLWEDTEGNLWVATGGGGLAMVHIAPFRELRPPGGWTGRAVLAVSPARSGGLWIGTEGGGLYRWRENEWQQFGKDDGMENPYVWSLLEDSNGQLIVGTWGGGGVFRRTPDGRFVRDSRIDPTMPVLALLADREGSIWYGTGAGLFGGRAAVLARDGAPIATGNRVVNLRSLAEDKEGNIWAGLLGGGLAVRRPDGRHDTLRQVDGLSSDQVLSLCPAADGGLWIGTVGGGLNRHKNGRFSAVTTAQGLPSNTIRHLLADGLGFLWLDTGNGVFRVSEQSLHDCADRRIAAVAGEVYGRSEGLPSEEITGAQAALTRTADGRLWFCTAKGLAYVDPGSLRVNRTAPQLLIENLTVDGLLRPSTGGIMAVLAGPRRLQIRYTAFNYSAPEKTRFRTRLVGIEEHWTEAGTAREAVFHLLPPGSYRFEMLACNNSGIWATVPAAQAFVVQPFFWQTWWFRIGVGGLVIAAASLAGIGAARVRLQRRIEEAERQQAVEHERARIARDIHDDLGASLTRLTLLSQTAMTENAAGRSTAPELNSIYDTASELTRSMDEIVWAVNPRHDSLDSLANFLGKFAQEYLQAAQIRCRLDLPAGLPPTPVPAEVRHNVFLATKEVLNNSVKHAGTTEVRLALAATQDGFRLTLEDNGRGFAPPAAGAAAGGSSDQRDGLANLHRRLTDSGGTCVVESAPGQGTRTIFTVSLQGSRADRDRGGRIS